MAKKSIGKPVNNMQSRLEDAKRQYDVNESMIKSLKKYIDSCDSISVKASNGTISVIPEFKQWQDLQKINTTLRKQINDMEILLQNGTISEEKEENPFK